MQPFTIRTLEQNDFESVFALAMKSWKFTYKNIFSFDFIETYVTRAYRKEALKGIKDQSSHGLTEFFVVQENITNQLIGFAQIGYDKFWETFEKNLPLRLFRIYLDPDFLGKGLGNRLLEKVEDFVKKTGEKSYIVGVHEKNSIGLQFYRKNGFIQISKDSDAEGEIYFQKTLLKN